jgi:hypothetical protein
MFSEDLVKHRQYGDGRHELGLFAIFPAENCSPHSTRTFARESGILLPGRVQWSATLFLNGKGANVIREVDIVSQR